MEEVVIAAGSNLGNRLGYIQKAGEFLNSISKKKIKKASVWESEPVGEAKFTFFNSAAKLTTDLPPEELLSQLKQFEFTCGRERKPKRWGPRVIDLDIIRYGNLVIQRESLIIPHPEYRNRLFVLLPMLQIDANWHDPLTGKAVKELVEQAPQIEIHQTEYIW
ncbi:MAG: 2-amino-4-hydroxy-6-hydroxymethyldihydropteridine diphosphokinase [Balneolaceae bacterium]